MLRGRLLASLNQAPGASHLLSPSDGESIVVGGTNGADPVDPEVYLGMVSLLPVDDPEGDPVAYVSQVSLRPGFNAPDQTVAFELGVESTRVPLTVALAAALFDTLSNRQPGNVLLHMPVTVFHRVLTTDGSRYTVGDVVETTFIRGTVTANESVGEQPAGFLLYGNYPNPFNPSTTLLFDLPAQAGVAVEVYDAAGRQVLVLPPQPMAAGTGQQIEIDASALPSGMYLYRVVGRTAAAVLAGSGRMTLLK